MNGVLAAETAIAKAVRKGSEARRPGDPHANSVSDSYTSDDYTEMTKLLASGAKCAECLKWDILMVAQAQAFVNCLHFGVGRGDDSRVMNLSDLGKPRKVDCLSGAVEAFVLPIALRGTKTQETARCYYLALMRAFDVFKCPVRSLGELLLAHFVIRGEPYPDPTNRAEWESVPLFRSITDRMKGMTYNTMAEAMRDLFTYLDIVIRKLTHAMRVGGAQALEALGATLELIMRVGRWLQSESVVAAYVTNSPPDGLLFMGGYKYKAGEDMRQAFWARRFMTILPEPLMQQLCIELFPFLPTFQERAAKVPKQGRDIRLSVHYHAAALMLIAKATVQDSLELADLSPTNSVVQWLCHMPAWRMARSAYEHALKHGLMDATRPRGMMELLDEMQQRLLYLPLTLRQVAFEETQRATQLAATQRATMQAAAMQAAAMQAAAAPQQAPAQQAEPQATLGDPWAGMASADDVAELLQQQEPRLADPATNPWGTFPALSAPLPALLLQPEMPQVPVIELLAGAGLLGGAHSCAGSHGTSVQPQLPSQQDALYLRIAAAATAAAHGSADAQQQVQQLLQLVPPHGSATGAGSCSSGAGPFGQPPWPGAAPSGLQHTGASAAAAAAAAAAGGGAEALLQLLQAQGHAAASNSGGGSFCGPGPPGVPPWLGAPQPLSAVPAAAVGAGSCSSGAGPFGQPPWPGAAPSGLQHTGASAAGAAGGGAEALQRLLQAQGHAAASSSGGGGFCGPGLAGVPPWLGAPCSVSTAPGLGGGPASQGGNLWSQGLGSAGANLCGLGAPGQQQAWLSPGSMQRAAMDTVANAIAAVCQQHESGACPMPELPSPVASAHAPARRRRAPAKAAPAKALAKGSATAQAPSAPSGLAAAGGAAGLASAGVTAVVPALMGETAAPATPAGVVAAPSGMAAAPAGMAAVPTGMAAAPAGMAAAPTGTAAAPAGMAAALAGSAAAAPAAVKGKRPKKPAAPYTVSELQRLPPGTPSYPKDTKTLLDMYKIFYVGTSVAPAFTTLDAEYTKQGKSWYPAQFKQRMSELRGLEKWCITKTSELRKSSKLEAAQFWTVKQSKRNSPALKPFWTDFVSQLAKKEEEFAAYVSKSRPPDFVSPVKGAAVRPAPQTGVVINVEDLGMVVDFAGARQAAGATASGAVAPASSGEGGAAPAASEIKVWTKPPHSGWALYCSWRFGLHRQETAARGAADAEAARQEEEVAETVVAAEGAAGAAAGLEGGPVAVEPSQTRFAQFRRDFDALSAEEQAGWNHARDKMVA
ncbi:hypothetical protein HXX76_002347 [Chlamydomonas incerta]|uniref:Ndc10 domain-containing protein n=1 Tax=Chlamydomonas incerta TaxID=51695 RepID=A0A835TNJ3_CHLIN|nr:hypothetical protein HXX76_002347 [Chlamydomonas incerta]|eukprot:KAG2442260.1 hypothetical protein HXX76_002347 [Chlamydomonas incerta]